LILRSNVVGDNTPPDGTGIGVGGSGNIWILRNLVTDNGGFGIRVNGTVGSLIAGNRISGHVDDVWSGAGVNCWRGNEYSTGSVTSDCP
jgi:parallel beta-helix repeat protein